MPLSQFIKVRCRAGEDVEKTVVEIGVGLEGVEEDREVVAAAALHPFNPQRFSGKRSSQWL